MKTLHLILQVRDQDWAVIEPTLTNVIDEDLPLGLRFKDLDNEPENTLAPQVIARVDGMEIR